MLKLMMKSITGVLLAFPTTLIVKWLVTWLAPSSQCKSDYAVRPFSTT